MTQCSVKEAFLAKYKLVGNEGSLGKGSFGSVSTYERLIDNKIFAVKCISYKAILFNQSASDIKFWIDLMKNEIELLKKFSDSPNVIKFIESF